jgi:iron(III) transport system substrate-binding protein
MKKLFFACAILLASLSASAATLTVYTDRAADRLTPIVAAFKAATGTDVTVVELPYADMIARIEAEGPANAADLLFVKDLVFLADLKKRDLLQPLTSEALNNRVLPQMKDKDNKWIGISFRARTLVYDPSRVNPSEISSYEELANDDWAGRVCMRTSKGTYNVALIANFVQNHGEAQAKELTDKILANLGADVFPNDTAMMTAIANGVCDIGIANTYYLGQMLNQNPNFPIKPLFANQNSTGVHTNGTGIGVTKTSKNAALAEKFISALLDEPAQLHLSAAQMEYPAAVNVTPNTVINTWGSFKVDQTNWSDLGEHVPAANNIIKELEYK